MMKKYYLNIIIVMLVGLVVNSVNAQSTGWNNPDSAKNITKPGVPWNITNPIGANHDTMLHMPLSVAFSDSSDYLYMYDLGFNVPANATIEGVEMILSRGACNAGSYFLDTVSLADSGMAMGNYITDSAGPSAETDTLGGQVNLWGATLSPAVINSNSFGVFYSMRSVGICTFAVFDCKLKVYYSLPTGLRAVSNSEPVLVYPNPASSDVVFETDGVAAGSPYRICDAGSRVLGTGTVYGGQTRVHIGELTAGMYIFKAGERMVRFIKK